MRSRMRFALAAVLLLALPAGLVAADGALTNDDVVKMAEAGLDEGLIVAKIQQADAVDFALETDDIIALKKAGVPQGAITAMLDRSTAPPSSGDGGFPSVSLIASDGTKRLEAIEGDHQQFAAPFVGLRHFLEFAGEAAEVHTKDRRPTLELRLDRDPSTQWFLVALDPDDDEPDRGLDLESAGVWGGAHTYEPDEDALVSFDMVESGGGLWRFRPKRDLKPGEYGLYCEQGFVYDFAVDR